MLRLVLIRIATMIPTVAAISALLFFSVTALLGSPAAMMLGEEASPQAIAALNAKYGFDRPAWQQFLSWAGAALQGDLGRSYTTQESVAKAVLACLPVTLELTVFSILLAAGAAIVCNTLPVGRGLIRPVVTGVNLIGVTVPNFMLGVTLILLFSVELGWLPSTGWVPWSEGPGTHLAHMVLPVLTLSAYYFGVFSIVYRAEYRDVAGRMFMRAARAKGLGEWAVAFRHAMPNAALPVITFIGISMGQLTGGAVVTETIFSMPGTGRLFVGAIAGHDFPVMLAVGMLIVVGVVLMNLLADIAYTIVNPLIRHD
ncbi:MAG: ABC transporter permease [Acetobacteraceae bacterium]|nr:ABC transporter permease [Acetobacteraceae bacterium]